MPYELFLALRYLRVRRGRRVVKLTAAAAVFGIACGVAALIVALALANGFRDELRDKILRGTAHVTLMRSGGVAINEPRAVVARVRGVEGVLDAAPTTYEGALLSGPDGSAYTVMRGLDAESARTLSEVRRTLLSGAVEPLFSGAGESDENPAPVIVGADLAARTGLARVGEEGLLITGEQSASPAGFMPRSRRVRVAGVFRAGLYDYDATWSYLSLGDVSRVAGPEMKSSAISIEVRDIYDAGALAVRVRRAMGDGWTTVDWREANRPLFAALELERRTVALIIMLIMLVAALNITTTLALVVVERRADIAVLGTMGAQPRGVMLIFMLEGALIGAIGALVGVALGLAACALGNYFRLVQLPADVYSVSNVPLHAHALDVVWPALAAFAVSLLATLYPARQASRVRPAEALRYE
ncbi:MAG: ABC transporter permease [Acidobacteria bacterium]|nr:ABC transporter permease [Acidobacteriota bacterium]